jgi:hypothetical protein
VSISGSPLAIASFDRPYCWARILGSKEEMQGLVPPARLSDHVPQLADVGRGHPMPGRPEA